MPYRLESRKECISIFVITNIGLCPKPTNLASTTAHIVVNHIVVNGKSGFGTVNIHSFPKEDSSYDKSIDAYSKCLLSLLLDIVT